MPTPWQITNNADATDSRPAGGPTAGGPRKPTLRDTITAAWDQFVPATPQLPATTPSRRDLIGGLVDQLGRSVSAPPPKPPMPVPQLDYTTNGREILDDIFTNKVRQSVGLGRPIIPAQAQEAGGADVANEYSAMGAFGVGVGQASNKVPYYGGLGALTAKALAAVLRGDSQRHAEILKEIEAEKQARANEDALYRNLQRVYPQATAIGEALPVVGSFLP